MKGKRKRDDEVPADSEEINKDVSDLAVQAASIAATWDDEDEAASRVEVAENLMAENVEVPVADIDELADYIAPQIEVAEGIEPEDELVAVEAEEETSEELAVDEAAAELERLASAEPTSTSEPVGTEEAFVREEDTLPKELSEVQAKSIMESVLFACVHPVSFNSLKGLFHGTNIDGEKLRDIINHMQTDYAGGERGITLDEVSGGYHFRTKLDNTPWLRKMVKARPFRLSGPALEVLSIIAYKQPVIKAEVDQIRGVESGHLVRALLEKNLVKFMGKSELPGKPMLYGTTKQFLELFGLRNIRELPTLSEIDKLIPEGIGEISEIDGETLGSLAEKIGLAAGKSYSESESELLSITESLSGINTSSEFFEQEKLRERERRDQERAQDLRERKIMGEELTEVDAKWLARFDAKIEAMAAQASAGAPISETAMVEDAPAGASVRDTSAAIDTDSASEMPVMEFTAENNSNAPAPEDPSAS